MEADEHNNPESTDDENSLRLVGFPENFLEIEMETSDQSELDELGSLYEHFISPQPW